MPQACVERALPSSIEIRRFAHTNFLANDARDLWKAKPPGGALVFTNARRGSWAAVQVSRSSRRPSATSWAMRLPARTWPRNRGLPPSAAPARRTALGSAGRIDTLLMLMRTPHRSQSFKLSSDPLVRDVVGLHLSPPSRALFSASELPAPLARRGASTEFIILRRRVIHAGKRPAAHCGRQWIDAAHELAP